MTAMPVTDPNMAALLGMLPPQQGGGFPVMNNTPPQEAMPLPGMQQSAPVQQEPMENKGMFGIKGTFRDILGTLGDAFLVQSGNQRVYAPMRQQEKRSEALQGFAQDPLAAIERLRGLDPAAAQEMLADFQKQQIAQEELGFKREDNTRESSEFADQTMDRAYRMLGTANDQNYPLVKAQVERYLGARGVDSPFTLPEKFDADAIGQLRSSSIPLVDQERLKDADLNRTQNLSLRQEGLNIQREGLDIRRSDTEADNARADRSQGERERRNRVTERQGDDRIEVARSRPAGRESSRRSPPSTPQEGQRRTINGVTYEWKGGRAVRVK